MDPTTAARVSTLLMLASRGLGMCRNPAGAEEPKGTMSSVDSDSLENAILPVCMSSFTIVFSKLRDNHRLRMKDKHIARVQIFPMSTPYLL